MGTLTLNVTKSTDTTGGISYTVDIADADLDRLSVAYAASYFPQGVTDTPGGTPRAPTSTEVVHAISDGLAKGMLANTHSFELQQATAKATASVTPIQVTPA